MENATEITTGTPLVLFARVVKTTHSFLTGAMIHGGPIVRIGRFALLIVFSMHLGSEIHGLYKMVDVHRHATDVYGDSYCVVSAMPA